MSPWSPQGAVFGLYFVLVGQMHGVQHTRTALVYLF